MALTDPTEINLETTGKLGNTVYYQVDGEKRERAYVIPVQPGTGQQRKWWAQFIRFVKMWQALNDAQKEVWNNLGDIFHMSGFNKYMSENLKEVA
ncbi:hypothetical protein KAR91_12300 [Candidatus Pacearchaeota archaeon]|nr:hypothetical protein [Candidatus Pacearchaeota archaeon]